MIFPTAFVWLAALGLLVASLAAIGAKVLHEIPWHALKDYCRRRNRLDIFDAIHDGHDEAALGAETLEVLAALLCFLATVGWLVFAGPVLAATSWTALVPWIVLGTLVLLALGVWIPWSVARLWAAPFLYHTWRIWWVTRWLLRPCVAAAHGLERLLRRLSGREERPSQEEAFEEEIRAIVTEGLHDGLLEADAREMIEGVIELGDADAADIMTPRSQMAAIPLELDWSELVRRVIQFGHTRLPVYQETLDHIAGILYVKDLLPELAKRDNEPRRLLREILREPWFVPKARRVDDLLQDFLQTRNHMAIVVDEYMAVAGLVTIEDVLEEIVGEIVDESDEEHVGQIRSIDENTAEVHGRAHLSDVNEHLGLDLPEPEEFDTIGGLVIHHLGRIPKSGETIQVKNVRITVQEASRRKVERLRLKVLRHVKSETV